MQNMCLVDCDSESSTVSETDKDLLLKAIRDSYVLHVRTAIDNYKDGNEEGYSDVDFSPYTDYLKSKFVLMEIDNNAIGGGKTMLIAFTDKPDVFFYVWVYDEGDGSLDLRTFKPYEEISVDQARQIYQSSEPMITELGLAI